MTSTSRDWILWSLSVVYLFGFTSLFVQCPGLIGQQGITPAWQSIEKEAESLGDFLTKRPTLLRLLPKIGLEKDAAIDFLCVAGAVVSFVAVISGDHRNALVAALQWIFYLSIAQVGHIFLSSKWDSLLLETGFVAIFLAPLGLFGLHDWKTPSTPSREEEDDEDEHHHHHHHRGQQQQQQQQLLPRWLMRWILFRLLLAQGLTSLVDIFGTNVHQETTEENLQNLLHLHERQVLPTAAVWFLNLLPSTLLVVCTAAHIVSHVLGSLLILLPSIKLRRLLFKWQCACAVIGVVLSNQGFYPLLLVTISMSLIGDESFDTLQFPWKKQVSANGKSKLPKGQENGLSGIKVQVENKNDSGILRSKAIQFCLACLAILGLLVCYGCPVLHSHGAKTENVISEWIVSVLHSLYGSTGFLILTATLLGGTSLALECVQVFRKAWYSRSTKGLQKVFTIARCLCLTVVTASLFFISLVPLTWANNQDSGNFLPTDLQEAYLWTHKHYKLVNNYMAISKRVEINGTAIGRLELILEGSWNQDSSDEWREYSFRFKPGHLSSSPYIIAPHQPRLDESLWFAAQSNYKQHHWVLNLVYRLLNNQEEVLELLGENPFPEEPPKYIKASIYEYNFAYDNQSEDGSPSSDWFRRKWIGHYLPILSKTDPSFNRYLKLSGMIRIGEGRREASLTPCKETNALVTFLGFLRSLLGHSNGSCLCLVLVLLGLLLTLVDPSGGRRRSSISPFSSSSQPQSQPSQPQPSSYRSSYEFDGQVYYTRDKEETRRLYQHHYQQQQQQQQHHYQQQEIPVGKGRHPLG